MKRNRREREGGKRIQGKWERELKWLATGKSSRPGGHVGGIESCGHV